jgi:enoyl-CoA hydratase/carnithine racemase
VAAMNAPTKLTQMNAPTKPAQIRLAQRSPAYWRVTIDNPPINVMGPEMVKQFQEVIGALETDEHVRVVVFDSAVDDYFLNHSDFMGKLEDLTSMPAGPTGLPPWPDFLARLTRLPVVSIALIRGRATGNGSEITLACDMSFASREKAIISQWEVGVGMVAGGGPMARLPELIGRNRALEVLLSSEDIRADQAEAYGYINRALPDADLDAFRRGARDPDRQVRQMGDRQHQAPRQHQPAAGRRARCWVGCVHRFARATCRPGGDQGTDRARLPQTGGCRKSARILSGPNCALGSGARDTVYVMSTVSKGAINERGTNRTEEL